MSVGPIQMIALAFDDFHPTGRILEALEEAIEAGAIRVVDIQYVGRGEDGEIEALEMTGLSEDEEIEFGAVIGALIGAGLAGDAGAELGAVEGALAAAEGSYGMTLEDVRSIATQLAPGQAAAMLMIEHRWATDLRDAIADAGGSMIAQGFLTPETLLLVGAELAAQAEALATIEAAAMVEAEAILEAAEAVAISEEIQAAAAQRAVEALVAARLVEEAAIEEAAEVIAATLELEDLVMADSAARMAEAEEEAEEAEGRAGEA